MRRASTKETASFVAAVFLMLGGLLPVTAQAPQTLPWSFLPPPFDRYLDQRVTELSDRAWVAEITKANWPEKQAAMRGELRRMLGLDPWPERSPLNPVTTGRVQGDGYTVEKFYFEPLPGLYIGANLYVPTEATKPLPTVLYMSGHAVKMEGDTRFGNKTGYQHHGSWFARHGFVCLILDTIDLGEIPGSHRGTGRLDRWWWAARGYTPAGVEAWVGIRALDYLESRPEVDRARIGMTGRSGGGIYTWWVGALDDRIRAAVPVAGITTLRDHVMEGAIEGHCDCMYMVNTARWDFDRVAALMAPRPLLISNTDSDNIYPLTGVMEIFTQTRKLYRQLGQEGNIGIHIAEGPHKDTQALNIGAFHWLHRFLKGGNRMDLLDEPAAPRHEQRDLKVFASIPADERVTTVDEFFVPPFSPPAVPASADAWTQQRDAWMQALRTDVFRAWPRDTKPAIEKKHEEVIDGLQLTVMHVTTQAPFTLPLWILHREGTRLEEVSEITIHVLDAAGWEEFRGWLAAGFAAQFPGTAGDAVAFQRERKGLIESSNAIAFFAPRGVGPTRFDSLPKAKQTHMLRRFLLLGESLESGQVWDIRQASNALRTLWDAAPLVLRSEGAMAANTLYASLYVDGIARLELADLPISHRAGPTYLNILRHLDLPQALAMAAERAPVKLEAGDSSPWQYPQAVVRALALPQAQLQIHRQETVTPKR